jgi:hypothetical protein
LTVLATDYGTPEIDPELLDKVKVAVMPQFLAASLLSPSHRHCDLFQNAKTRADRLNASNELREVLP